MTINYREREIEKNFNTYDTLYKDLQPILITNMENYMKKIIIIKRITNLVNLLLLF